MATETRPPITMTSEAVDALSGYAIEFRTLIRQLAFDIAKRRNPAAEKTVVEEEDMKEAAMTLAKAAKEWEESGKLPSNVVADLPDRLDKLTFPSNW